MDEETPSEKTKIVARDYQVELLQKSLKQNSIVYLGKIFKSLYRKMMIFTFTKLSGTGAGKTFIASMIIKEMKAGILKEKQKSVFLVHRVPLVSQQAKFFANQNPDLKVHENEIVSHVLMEIKSLFVVGKVFVWV